MTKMAAFMYQDIVNSLEMDAVIFTTIVQLLIMISKMKVQHKTKYIQKTKPRYRRTIFQKSKNSKVDSQGPLALRGKHFLLYFVNLF